jgi:hypothetical protein
VLFLYHGDASVCASKARLVLAEIWSKVRGILAAQQG